MNDLMTTRFDQIIMNIGPLQSRRIAWMMMQVDDDANG